MSACNTLPTAHEEELPSPEHVAIAAAERLLLLQARDAAGWPADCATDYESSTYARPPLTIAIEDAFASNASLPATWAEPYLAYTEEDTRPDERGRASGLVRPSATCKPADLGAPLPRAITELMEYHDLLRVFEDARDSSPPQAGGYWWALRMEARTAVDIAGEVGADAREVRTGALTYEAAIISGLARIHG